MKIFLNESEIEKNLPDSEFQIDSIFFVELMLDLISILKSRCVFTEWYECYMIFISCCAEKWFSLPEKNAYSMVLSNGLFLFGFECDD